MAPIKLALVGLGKIARDQHLPAIAGTQGLELSGIASRHASVPNLAHWTTIDDMLASNADIDAVSLCTPPQGRFAQAKAALEAGKHLMLEKPPGATLSEVQALEALAKAKGLTLFATWHSRFASAVEEARALLSNATIRSVTIEWKEDVRHWHPGQEWIWQPGGLGVFDPGINALSIVTRILREKFYLTQSDLFFPENRAAPIAANLDFELTGGATLRAEFDWRQTGPQTWDIRVETDAGQIVLSQGGNVLTVNGTEQAHPSGQKREDREYRSLYGRFMQLMAAGRSDVDLSPLTHVADAFMLGNRHAVETFEDTP
ncbi:Gfo/Idh/MocA family oxidoreductase [Rhizobium sp. CFBP 8762]|uniref:Gfo/Idh/MocA family protein n=1 Tax=Rhizobium sp. CFBP 8762 TaxID=2775279 RepID=UPI00177E87B6|nr:Gfo/Idh/MocA family oxidoreductase [Rhizobium sp. CFBP 8762]MBD8554228.1 Gfo/Idh/MocA family oxidoreductase [Rhizobium sp. CFBP 8762]